MLGYSIFTVYLFINIVYRFNPNIVLGIRNFADTLGCSQLVNAADKYIQQNFRDVSLSEEFLSVMGSELIKIVKNDELDVSSEEEVGIIIIFCGIL